MSQHNEQYTPGLNRKRLLFSLTAIPKLIGRGKGTHCPGRTQVTANSPKRLEPSRGRGTRTCILILNPRVWPRAHSGQITRRTFSISLFCQCRQPHELLSGTESISWSRRTVCRSCCSARRQVQSSAARLQMLAALSQNNDTHLKATPIQRAEPDSIL